MFNTLFPFLNAGDAWIITILPLSLSISLWGALAGALAMAVYAVISPQKSIASLSAQARTLRKKMADINLDASEFSQLGKENVKVSLVLLTRVILPALISSLPVILVALWLNIMYGYQAKIDDMSTLIAHSEGQSKQLVVKPATHSPSASQDKNTDTPRIEILADGKSIYTGDPLHPPTPIIHKRASWNALLENPVGYLAEDSTVEVVYLDLPVRQILTWSWLPLWASGWETPFFLAVFCAALMIKLGFRIH